MRPTLEERTARMLRKMLPGGFAGRSEQISPVMAPLAVLQTYRPAAEAAVGTPTSLGVPTEVATYQVVNDGKYNAFPWITKTVGGKLVCVYREGAGHLSADGRITIQTSTDNGVTWSAKDYIASPDGGVTTYDLRDPSICTTATDRLVVNFYDFELSGSFYRGIYTMHSDDDGTTWSTPAKITPFTAENVTDGNILAHSSGRLLMPVYGQNTGDTTWRNAIMASTDNGVTWTGPTYINAANSGIEETTLIELANGDVMAFSRDDVITQVATNTSSDVGATWTAPRHLGFNVTPGRPGAGLFPNGQILLFYRQASTESVVYRWSNDTGLTWSAENVWAVPVYLYSGVCLIPPNTLAWVISEEQSGGASAEISFATYQDL